MGGVAGSWLARLMCPADTSVRVDTPHGTSGSFVVAIPINARLISQSFPDRRGPSRFVWRAEDRGGNRHRRLGYL